MAILAFFFILLVLCASLQALGLCDFTGKARRNSILGIDSHSDQSKLVSPAPIEADWSLYDQPAFLRRGMPMPTLESAPVKKKKRNTRKRGMNQETAPVAPSVPVTGFGGFELVA